jgi:hypothetical protein
VDNPVYYPHHTVPICTCIRMHPFSFNSVTCNKRATKSLLVYHGNSNNNIEQVELINYTIC